MSNTASEHKRPTVLVVDDTPANLSLLASLLGADYRVQLANSGQKALELAAHEAPALILLDVMMPGMDGFEVCRRLKAAPATARVPVLFLTAATEVADEELGLALGAVDFIHKPISPPIVKARVKAQLAIRDWQDFLHDQNAWLQQQVQQRLTELNHLQQASVHVMVSLAEFRDETTGNHIRRTAEYVRLLASELARRPRDAAELTPERVEALALSAPLHDIGKIAIPDHILLKPGKFTPEEWTIMQTHAERGDQILQRAGAAMGERGRFLALARQIARSHHEKWDGSGYPDRLSGTAIPLAARLMAVADVFDALLARRPYKEPMPAAQAAELIRAGRGGHFDPDVVDAFELLLPTFEQVAIDLADQ